MARGSGSALAGFLPGALHHVPSGVDYRVFLRDGTAWMSYDRPASSPAGALHGEHQLLNFVGSGRRGRTFLYQQAGLWFELPINFYGKRGLWDMAPAFDNVTRMPAPLPVDPNCLHCHATDIATPEPTARNRFAGSPFAQGGIGCSSCHGDPTAHLAAPGGHGPILNPDKLSVTARDSACIQCHLEGDAVVYRPGRTLAQFRPGDSLDQVAVYFVRRAQAAGGARASSQYEALLQSACKRASGDKLTCTTCHDPHSSPAPADRVAFFRAKCLACHTAPALAATHHPEQPDCARCHMPTRDTADISHEQLTDHNIQRRPRADEAAALHLASLTPADNELVPVGDFQAGDRELGLAYAQLAQRGDQTAGRRALALLTRAEAAGASDEQLHLNLGFLQQLSGHAPVARAEYAAALGQNPYEPGALGDLAVLDAATAHLPEALRLLDRLVTTDPSQTAAGLNLASLQCQLGQPAEARATAQRLAPFNPDDPRLRHFLATGRFDQGKPCTP